MTEQIKQKIVILIVALVILLLAGLGVLYFFSYKYNQDLIPDIGQVVRDVVDVVGEELTGEPPSGISEFASEADFKEYLSTVQSQYADDFFGGVMTSRAAVSVEAMPEMAFDDMAMGEMGGLGMGGAMEESERVSETNVQTAGIDEPDIVKTDGQELYYSHEDYYYYYREPVFFEDDYMIPPPYESQSVTYAIDAFPLTELGIDSEIEMTGDLLLVDDVLIVLQWDQVVAYDVTIPSEPTELWTLAYDESSYETARLYNGQLYLITSTWIDVYGPCPIQPFSVNGTGYEIACADIHHPVRPVPTDSTYDIFMIDPLSGEVNQQISFVGSFGDSVVYMSANNIYLTYSYPENFVDIMIDFFDEEAYDLVSVDVLTRLRNLDAYDISEQAKLVEFQVILEEYLASLDADERLRLDNEFENRMNDYTNTRKREFLTTGIVKIDNDSLKINANGAVPGFPLNQFSLDEYDDHLRIATTIESNWWGFMSPDFESVNDVYVLDKHLKQTGSILDMGEGEQIYSARFLGEEGYVVTFREIDPFYVLDLSNPKNPERVGELKIPGYSSYLHPLAENRVLGIGKEDGQVKLSIFDVSDPANPTEASKYLLDEYWSDVLDTHTAYLQDPKFEIFFLPGGRGGYVFSYANDELGLVKAVATLEAERAIFINDNLYVIGMDEIRVFDENTWEEVASLSL